MTRGLNEMACRRGAPPVEVASVRRWVSMGGEAILRGAFGAKADLPGDLEEFRDIRRGPAADPADLYPGVPAMLAALKQEGYRVAVCTNKREDIVVPYAAGLGIASHLDAILGGAPGRHLKPDPMLVHMALERLGADTHEAIFVGDSEIDAETALAAGLRFVLVTFGYPLNDIAAIAADARIDCLDALLSLASAMLADRRMLQTERPYYESTIMRQSFPRPGILKGALRMPTRASSAFPGAQPQRFRVKLHACAARLFRALPTLSRKTMMAGDIADFIDWQQRVFGVRPMIFGRREKLWERLAQRLDPNRPLVVMEFGVAWGYATNWWLRRLGRRDVVWHGFDRFTGLPRAWREHAQGTFDAGGTPPAIDDNRVRWHVGDVEDTLGAIDLVAARNAQWLILFDLDIYEPTAFAWEVIAPYLQPGDLMYFDEAMDVDERRVLNEMILPSIGCEPVGTTALGLGLAVTRPAAQI